MKQYQNTSTYWGEDGRVNSEYRKEFSNHKTIRYTIENTNYKKLLIIIVQNMLN